MAQKISRTTRGRQQKQDGRRYAKIADAADYINCNPYTIRAMLADGRLTAYRLGPRIMRVDLNEVDAQMAAGGEEVRSWSRRLERPRAKARNKDDGAA